MICASVFFFFLYIYPASLEPHTNAIANKMKSPNNGVYDYFTILLENDYIIFIKKTFKGEFEKIAICVIKNTIFPKLKSFGWMKTH